jgi:creatinine amidohydrolase
LRRKNLKAAPFVAVPRQRFNAIRLTQQGETAKMMPTVAMGEMSWVEYSQRVAEPGKITLVPAGAIEQHGPHLPLKTDVLIPTEIALEAARRTNAIVAPAIVYGYKSIQRSGGGNHFCGNTSLDAMTVVSVTRDILRELARHGIRRVVFVNGHFENSYFLLEGADLAIRDLAAIGINNFEVVTLSYWDFITKDALSEVFPEGFPGWALEHAGVMETSLMLHLSPQLVDMSLAPADAPAAFPPYDVLPPVPGLTPPSGCLVSPVEATSAKGRILFETAVSGIANLLRTAKAK